MCVLDEETEFGDKVMKTVCLCLWMCSSFSTFSLRDNLFEHSVWIRQRLAFGWWQQNYNIRDYLNCVSPSFFRMIQVLEVARSIAHLRCSHSHDTRGKHARTPTHTNIPSFALTTQPNINFHSQSEINVIKLSILKVSITIFCLRVFNFAWCRLAMLGTKGHIS